MGEDLGPLLLNFGMHFLDESLVAFGAFSGSAIEL